MPYPHSSPPPADRLCITHDRPRPGVAVVRPAGEMDSFGAPAVAELVADLAGTCSRIVLDMRLVTFLDARGIHALLEGDHSARRHQARQIVVGLNHSVLRILRICHVDRDLTLADVPADDPARAADLPLDDGPGLPPTATSPVVADP